MQTEVALVSGPNRPSCQAQAGRHGKSGGTDAEALPPLGSSRPLSYEVRPIRGAFFVCVGGDLPLLPSMRLTTPNFRSPSWTAVVHGTGFIGGLRASWPLYVSLDPLGPIFATVYRIEKCPTVVGAPSSAIGAGIPAGGNLQHG